MKGRIVSSEWRIVQRALPRLPLHRGDFVPQSAVLLLELCVRVHPLPKILLLSRFLSKERLLQQRPILALVRLEPVLHKQQFILRDAPLLIAACLKFGQHAAKLGKVEQRLRLGVVALQFQHVDRVLPVGSARMP